MLPKEDRKAMLLRLYNEDTPLMDHSKDRFFKANARTEDETAAVVVKDGEEEEGDGGVVGDVENGTMDGDVEREMQDDEVADAVKAEVGEEEEDDG